jgi:hypothetical protein
VPSDNTTAIDRIAGGVKRAQMRANAVDARYGPAARRHGGDDCDDVFMGPSPVAVLA